MLLAMAGNAFAFNFQVVRTSAADFFIDAGNGLVASYASYVITNNDGVTHNDVWVKIGSFTGGVVSLNDPTDNTYHIGPMNNGDVKPSFFYLKASGTTTTAQGHSIQLFDGNPAQGGTLMTTNNFTLSTVQSLIQANANKITGGSVTPQPSVSLGQDITITLTGQSGTLGAGPGGTIPANQLYFTPAALGNWPSKSFKIISSVITLSNGQTGTFTNTLAMAMPGSSACDYTATYTLRAVNTTSSPTAVEPIAYINSGAQVKHTTLSSIGLITPTPNPTIPTVTNGCILTVTAAPSTQAPGGTVTYTVTATNTGPIDVTLDNFTVVLQNAQFTYQAGSSQFNGGAQADPTINAQTLTYQGPFLIPTGTNRKLVFNVTAPNALGSYTSSVSVTALLHDPPCIISSVGNTNTPVPAVTTLTVANLPPPSITTLNPNGGKVGDPVQIVGTGFTGVSSVTFNGTAATFTFVDDQHINTGVPPGATSGNVSVTNAVGSATKPFTVFPPPLITSLTPNNGVPGDPVTINGVNFTGVNSVKFGNVAATFTFVDDQHVTTNVPVGAGSAVTVATANGGVSLPSPFTVNGAPIVTNLNPTSGVPGTTVVITGSGFTGADQPGNGVSFGLIAATVFTVDSDTQITATVPTGAITGGVVVKTASGSSAPQTFTVPAPTITNFTPNAALPGDTIALTGQFFTGVTGVTIGGNAATFTFNSDTSVSVTVPNAVGNGTIALTTPAGTATTATFSFPAPSITSFTPTAGIVGSTVVVTGLHFTQATVVTFGGVNAPTFTIDSDTQITATVPNGAASGVIAVTVPGGTADSSNAVPASYQVIGSPTIADFNPKSGLAGVSVVITGTNFTNASGVDFNTVAATGFTIDSDTQITAIAPGGNSTGKITVHGAARDVVSVADFTLLFAPTVTSFAPTSGPVGTTVTIGGTHFTGATAVSIGGVAAATFTVDNDTSITAVVGNTAITGKVSVTTPNGTADSTALNPQNFTVIPLPVIGNLNPNTGVRGTVVTITGTGFIGTNPATGVKFGAINATSVTINSDTEITATAPVGVITAGVTVTTAGGTSLPQTFTVPAPVVTSFTPTQGLAGTVVVITGTSFTDATNVKFNNVAATTFTVNSDTQITATAPVNVSNGKISVTTLAGTGTSAADFTLPVPTITAFAPVSGIVGTSVVITGTNFNGATVVSFGGVNASQFTVDSNTQITAKVPANAASGKVAVTVPGGTADSSVLVPAAFTVIGAPTITSFAPTGGFIGSTVTITGSGFNGATGVKFGGVSATTFTVNNDGSITVVVPAGASSGPITVIGVGGTAVSVQPFTVIGAPTITSFTPTSGKAGTTVTLTGTAFTGATAVTIGGVAVTSFVVVNDTTITLVVPGNGLSGPIKVTTPGGSATTQTNFSILPTITSFTPQTGGPGSVVIIKGTNFTGTTGVTIGGVPVTSFTVNDDGTITVVVGAGGVSGDIVVTTSGGSAAAATPFVVVGPPTVTAFTPSAGQANANVAVTGTLFTGATSVTIGGTAVKSFTVVNDTTITLVAGSGTTGPISVTTPNGTGTSAANFTFQTTSAAVVAVQQVATVVKGGSATLPPFQIRNTGTTVQTLTAVTVQITNPSSFSQGSLTATASAGTVTATALPQSTTVFTFSSPLLLQPGELATINLTLQVASNTGAIAMPVLAATSSIGLAFMLIGFGPRRALKGLLTLAVVAVVSFGLTGCGGGHDNHDGSVSGASGGVVNSSTSAAPTTSSVMITNIAGKGPNGETVNYEGLPTTLGNVVVQK